MTNTKVLMDITARPPQIMSHGEGSWLVDTQGKRYLDFIQGWAVNTLGHASPVISQALQEQSRRLVSPSPAFYNQPAIDLATRIVDDSPFDQVFFCNSGAEANEGAIKLARRWGEFNRNGAYEIITFDDAFHGRTLTTMAASGKAAFKPLFEPKTPGFPKARLNDLASVEALITDKTVAVMLEPIQGEAGVVPATNAFMVALRELTRKRGLLLIVDEVQTGVARTGKRWGFEHSGITPDVMTLGKGLGGGVPLAALVATDAASVFRHGDQGGTYNGNPLMTAVGSAILEVVFKPSFLQAVVERGQHLADGLRDLSRRHGMGEVRGHGLLLALDLGRPVGDKLVEAARENGLLLNSPRPSWLRLMPALNVQAGEIDAMLAKVDALLTRV